MHVELPSGSDSENILSGGDLANCQQQEAHSYGSSISIRLIPLPSRPAVVVGTPLFEARVFGIKTVHRFFVGVQPSIVVRPSWFVYCLSNVSLTLLSWLLQGTTRPKRMPTICILVLYKWHLAVHTPTERRTHTLSHAVGPGSPHFRCRDQEQNGDGCQAVMGEGGVVRKGRERGGGYWTDSGHYDRPFSPAMDATATCCMGGSISYQMITR
jgi:hypothetical protein